VTEGAEEAAGEAEAPAGDDAAAPEEAAQAETEAEAPAETEGAPAEAAEAPAEEPAEEATPTDATGEEPALAEAAAEEPVPEDGSAGRPADGEEQVSEGAQAADVVHGEGEPAAGGEGGEEGPRGEGGEEGGQGEGAVGGDGEGGGGGEGGGDDDGDGASMHSRLSESDEDLDDAAGDLEGDELLASLLDGGALAEDMAGKIEGFDDDFARSEEEEENHMDEDLESQDLALDERILEAKRRWDAGMELHRMLEARISAFLAANRGGQQHIIPEEAPGSLKFHHKLSTWQALRTEKQQLIDKYERQQMEMSAALEEKRRKADEITRTYRSFVVEVAKGAEMSRSGKAVSLRDVKQALADIARKEEELQKVRLRAVQLRARYDKAEATMKSKEQLAEGLHLIDFEQLKIENQSLNEKIEERNEELSKLSRKAMASVLVLTHVKEKLQFVERENMNLSARLEHLDGTLGNKRDTLHDLKLHRDKTRQTVTKMKEQKTTISQPMLIEDLEQQRIRRNELRTQLANMREQLQALNEESAHLKARAMATTSGPNTRGLRSSVHRSSDHQS